MKNRKLFSRASFSLLFIVSNNVTAMITYSKMFSRTYLFYFSFSHSYKAGISQMGVRYKQKQCVCIFVICLGFLILCKVCLSPCQKHRHFPAEVSKRTEVEHFENLQTFAISHEGFCETENSQYRNQSLSAKPNAQDAKPQKHTSSSRRR